MNFSPLELSWHLSRDEIDIIYLQQQGGRGGKEQIEKIEETRDGKFSFKKS